MKKIFLNILIFFKRISILGRLFLPVMSLILCLLIFIPDLKFNLEVKKPKKFTIEEIRKTPKELLPMYIILDNSQLIPLKKEVSDSAIFDSIFGKGYLIDSKVLGLKAKSYDYIEEQRINKKGDTILSSILYPIYSKTEIQKNPNASASELNCYVVIRDINVNKDMLKGDKYFTESTFSINGQFQDGKINEEYSNLLKDGGYKIDKEAIILLKGSKPMSLFISFFLTTISLLTALFCIFSFLPRNILERLFGLEKNDNNQLNASQVSIK